MVSDPYKVMTCLAKKLNKVMPFQRLLETSACT